jgi:hypothetical protein
MSQLCCLSRKTTSPAFSSHALTESIAAEEQPYNKSFDGHYYTNTRNDCKNGGVDGTINGVSTWIAGIK